MSDQTYKFAPVEVRFMAKVAKRSDGCWQWTSFVRPDGYPMFRFGQRAIRAHRFAYELLVGPIPEGMQLDHLCRNRACVNPTHREPVTHRENIMRGLAPTAQNARKTHCKRGHPLEGDNVYRSPRGHRTCRTCKRLSRKRVGGDAS